MSCSLTPTVCDSLCISYQAQSCCAVIEPETQPSSALLIGYARSHWLLFTVLTDHKPLFQVFNLAYDLTSASLRVQRLVLKVQKVTFTIQSLPGKFSAVTYILLHFVTYPPPEDALLVHYPPPDYGLSTSQQRLLTSLTSTDPLRCSGRAALRSDCGAEECFAAGAQRTAIPTCVLLLAAWRAKAGRT